MKGWLQYSAQILHEPPGVTAGVEMTLPSSALEVLAALLPDLDITALKQERALSPID